MPPPTQRRPDRTQANAASRSRMYNLAGHAHSSGSLLPRSTHVHAASTSAATSSAAAVANRAVDASDAPYLTNLESHFGRVTLTAPDNLLRKQAAKEKKQKIRQKKAQNAQAAAAALAGATQNAFTSSVGRNAAASSSNLLDSSRRYQTTLDDAPVSTGLLLPSPAQHVGMRRAYSGNQTPTLASTSHLQTPPSTTVTRTRRRRQSAAGREDSSRPASRASGTSRPDSALSFNDNDAPQSHSSASTRTQQASDERPPRSRTESAPAVQRRSQNAFARAQDDDTAPAQPLPSATTAPQTSLHRQNVWNDITEADPDDLPPPFPEGAPRPPTPPRPPSHSEAANDAQLIGPQRHACIPSSPPPPFVSDDEDDTGPAAATSTARESQEQPVPDAAVEPATVSRSSSRASNPSSASASEDESIELTEERRAWEADIQNGLSFEVRMLREQQRRVARERALTLRAAEAQEVYESAEEEAAEDGESAAVLEPMVIDAEVQPQPEAASTEEAATADTMPSAPPTDAEHIDIGAGVENGSAAPPSSDGGLLEQATAVEANEIEANAEQTTQPHESEAVTMPAASSPAAVVEPESNAAQAASPAAPQSQPEPLAPASQISPAAPAHREQTLTTVVPSETDISGRRTLANEPRLGLLPMSNASPMSSRPATARLPSSSAAPRRISGHRKTNSDTRPADAQVAQASASRASLGGLISRRLNQGQAVRGHDSDSHLPLSRRPEDTLYVISAPPPAIHGTSSSEGEAVAQHAARGQVTASTREGGAVSDASSQHAALDDEDDGAESDSSIEQWLAEAAAFDALRKREEEAVARLQALREPPVSDSDEDDDDAVMPGAFAHGQPSHRRQVSAARKVPDPANLALMDQALPKAPPPLVLGRSRGGAAYSDSSSESTDTDELLDQYSSSDEDDEQHRAFWVASVRESFAGVQTPPNDPFVNSHKSVHVRNTSSAPNLTILDDSDDESSGAKPKGVAPVPPPKSGGAQAVDTQATRSDAPTRSLSLKAKGKLPERDPAPTTVQQPDTRAGDFEEDTSSSRDISDADDAAVRSNRAESSAPMTAPLGSGNNIARQNSAVSLTRSGATLPAGMAPPSMSERRASLDPLLQPLGYGRTDLGNRLKGLFGQPLVGGSSGQVPASLSAHAAAAAATQALSAEGLEARRSLGDSRRVSGQSEKEAEAPVATAGRRTSDAVKAEPSASPDATSQRDDNVSIAPSKASTLRRQSSAGSRVTALPSASADKLKATLSSSTPPEQKARDEALAQIAQLSATTQRQDSLAALERLLAKTGRPTSMLPPSAISRAELGGRLQPSSNAATSASPSTSESLTSNDRPPPPTNRLSRSGAIIRNRPDVPSRGPLPSSPSALSRAASTTRPVSFVNPRSSAAPLPRGRLPAITDDTRHFPPSASTGPGVAPSWLSYIPADERERLPAPLEPQRASAGLRTPGSRVSAMISRFEAPSVEQQGGSGSPTKQIAPWEGGRMAASESSQSSTSNGVEGHEAAGEPAVFRRFSRTGSSGSGGGTAGVSGLQRRPPPPPPTLPTRRTDTNPFRRSETSNESQLVSSASMEALARQIEEAASDWSSEALHRPASQVSENGHRASLLAPRSATPSATQGGVLPRSPRTQAMDTLTRHEHDADAQTPPMRPPKSPLITPEQILAGGSRNGLSASIAAAQAAAFARRDGRHSSSSSVDAGWRRVGESGEEGGLPRSNSGSVLPQPGARPLPSLPSFLRGLGISGEEPRDGGSGDGGAEMPPPLPIRPRDRVWAPIGSGSGTGLVASGSGSRRALPSIPTSRSASSVDGQTGQSSVASPAVHSSSQVISSPTVIEPARDMTASPNTSAASPSALASTSNTTTATPPPEQAEGEPSSSTRTPLPRRDASLGLTDFDLLVASLDHPSSGGPSYDRLSAISDFLGPAKPTSLSPSQLSSLFVGVIECDSRRVTKEGKVKQKLSCVGVRVDKCPICLAQFREGQRAVILKCGHIMHETCGRELFKRTDRCGVCRASAV